MCARMCMGLHTGTNTDIQTDTTHTYTYTHPCIHTQTYACTCAHTHMHVHNRDTYTYTYYTYMYTTHTHVQTDTYPRDDAPDECVQFVKTTQPQPHQYHGNVSLPPMPVPTQSEYRATQHNTHSAVVT